MHKGEKVTWANENSLNCGIGRIILFRGEYFI